MVMFYHFQMFFRFLLLILDFIVIGMWKPILIGCTNKVDWLIDWLIDWMIDTIAV